MAELIKRIRAWLRFHFLGQDMDLEKFEALESKPRGCRLPLGREAWFFDERSHRGPHF